MFPYQLALAIPHLLQAAGLSLGLVFLVSLAPKLRNPGAFVMTVDEYRVTPRVLSPFVAWAVIFTEGFLAVALLTGLLRDVAVLVAPVLLITLLAVVAITLRRGRTIPCGCFGATSEKVSPRSLVRLLMLLVVATAQAGVRVLAPGSPNPLLGTPFIEVLVTGFLAVTILLLGSWILHLPDLARVLNMSVT